MSSVGVSVPDEHPNRPWLRAPWKPGETGNPAGRPKGSRNKLGDAFIEALHDDFKEHGKQVIEKVRLEKPDQYLKVVASILPKQLEIKEGAFDSLSDEQITALVMAARSALGIVESSGERSAPEVIEGTAEVIPAVSQTG